MHRQYSSFTDRTSAARWRIAASLCVPALLAACARTGHMPLRSEAYELSVEQAVEEVLAADPVLTDHPIAVDIQQGIAILQGEAENLLARRRAEAVTQTIRGVRGVVNLIRVEPPFGVGDDRLRQEVEQALHVHPATRAERIDVKVEGGEATLRGVVDSDAAALLAERVVERIEGLRAVENELSVRPGDESADAALKAAIEARLYWDPLLDASLVRVQVNGGHVALVGTVGHVEERNRAIAAAWGDGVSAVDASALEVELWARDIDRRVHPPTGVSDDEIERALKFALRLDPRVHASSVDVDVSRARVVLRGTVDDRVARHAAAADALATLGVKRVQNLLAVAPGGGQTVLGPALSAPTSPHPCDLANGREPVGVCHQSATRQDTLDADLHLAARRAAILARCQQQERCGFIGAKGRYVSMEACTRSVAAESQLELSALTCTATVNEDAVEACVVELRTTDCALPFALENAASCDVSMLCRAAP